MTTIGDADIYIGADASGFRSSLDRTVSSIAKSASSTLANVSKMSNRELSQMFTSAGNTMQKVGGKMTNWVTKPILGATVAAGGLTAALGFKRLVGIDTARGQFKGLGYDAEKVMKQVDRGVTNTSLSMAEGASAAVAILATGNLPLKDLEGQIKRVANVSAAFGVEASQAGYLLNNVLTKNKVTYGDLSQMVRNQIPIISELAKHYGVTGDEIEAMANRGEISIEDFNKVLDNVAGKAALEYANTWSGVTKNIIANLGKIGAKVMEPTFELVKEEAKDLLKFLQSEDFSAWAEDMGQKVAEVSKRIIGAIRDMIDWWNQLSETQKSAFKTFGLIALAAGPAISVLGSVSKGIGTLIRIFPGLGTVIKGAAAGMSAGLAGAAGASSTLSGKLGLLARSAGGLAPAIAKVTGIVGLVIGVLVKAWKNSETFRNSVKHLGETFFELGKTVFEGVEKIWNALQPLFELGGDLFNDLAGIIGDVLGFAIEGLVAVLEVLIDLLEVGLTAAAEGLAVAVDWLVEVFKGGEDSAFSLSEAWESVKETFEAVYDWFTGTFLPTLSDGWNQILEAVQPVVEWFRAEFGPAFQEIGEVAKAIFDELVEAGQVFGEKFQELWTAVRELWDEVWLGIQETWDTFIKPFFDRLGEDFGQVWAEMQAWWDAHGETLIENIKIAWEVLKVVFQTIWEVIKVIFQTAWDVIKTIVTVALDIITGLIKTTTAIMRGDWSAAWEAIKGIFKSVWDGIVSLLESFGGLITGIVSALVNGVKGIWNATWNNIKRVFSSIWNSIVSAASGFANSVRNTFNNMMTFIGSIPGRILGFFGNMGSLLISSGRSLIDGFKQGIMSAFESVKNAVSNGLSAVRSLFPFSPAKEGPFSGRGWVSFSGESLGEEFMKSASKSIEKGRDQVAAQLGHMSDMFKATDAFENLALDGMKSATMTITPILGNSSDLRRSMDFGTRIRPLGASPTASAPTSNNNSRNITIEKGAIEVNGNDSKKTSLDVLDRIVEELGD